MQTRKALSVLPMAICFCLIVNITVLAGGLSDLPDKGSISVTMLYEGNAVLGGTLMLYRVGRLSEESGSWHPVLTEDFAESQVDLSDISSAETAGEAAQYAQSHGLSGTMAQIGSDGKAVFSDLERGVYLVVQQEAAPGYYKAAPFLVSIPMEENGVWRYDVDADPKIKAQEESGTQSTPPSSSDEPGEGIAKQPPLPALPQTGQLNWPVPVMAALGLLLFSAGWLLRFGKKRGDHEK